jgi:hypothetical protein
VQKAVIAVLALIGLGAVLLVLWFALVATVAQ